MTICFLNNTETPLPAPNKTITPGLSYLVLFVRGGGLLLPLPFPISDPVHADVQLICLFYSSTVYTPVVRGCLCVLSPAGFSGWRHTQTVTWLIDARI